MRADMYVDAVLKKCELFSSCTVWTREPNIRPRAWLRNFEESERPLAAVLLDHFVYFGAEATNQLLASCLRRIGSIIHQYQGYTKLQRFVREVIFTPVLGEAPNVTDSGQLICRKARQILAVSDEAFVSLARAHELLQTGRPLVFLDDFIGSGDQMATTWKRESKAGVSCKSIAENMQVDVTYVALVGTRKGCERLHNEFPELRVIVAHVIDEDHSVRTVPSNPLQPDIDNLPEKIEDLIQKYYSVLSLPAYLHTVEEKKYGYSSLGLLLAFEHSVPDATLPLLWATGQQGWTPLARRV